jgi:hypothetical protein
MDDARRRKLVAGRRILVACRDEADAVAWFLKTPDDCHASFLHSSFVVGSGSTDTLSMRMPPQPKLVRLVKEIVVVPAAPVP